MINYKHLHYFWVVAIEGGIARASERLTSRLKLSVLNSACWKKGFGG